jgi:DNA polymerase-3 subunit gamma/tau
VALALYRTYRPGTLADVVGQAHVTGPLARALDADRTHHAYLFSGPRGCGKTSTARILARSLNCEQGPTSTPCGRCRSCLDLAPNGPGSIDVVELDAATHRGIDDARELREKAIYAPAASRYRVYIIDEAHQLTPEASNALLKLIEEPPAHLRFIFATTEPDKIIATIRSRTFHYPFRLMPARTLTEHLARVCQAEGVPAEPAALAVVARAGAGSVRDSLSVLGQLLAGAGPEGLTHADAVQALGLTDDALIDGFVGALSAGSVAQMLAVVDAVISAGHDPRRFVSDVLDRLRDLIVLNADPGALQSGLIDLPDEAGERLLAQAEVLSLAELSHAADQVSVGLSEIKGATAPRLQLELLCARLALHHPGDTLFAVLARLERLEREVAAGPRRHEAIAPRRPEGPGSAVDQAHGRAPASESAGVPDNDPAAPSHPVAASGGASAEAGAAASPTAPPAATRGPGSGRAPGSPPRRPTLSSRRSTAGGTASGARGAGPAAGGSSLERLPEELPSASQAAPAGAGPSNPVSPAAAPATPAATPPSAPPRAGRPAAGPHVPLAGVTAAWQSVLDRIAQGSRVAWTTFADARPLSLSDGVLAVAVPDQGKAAAITQRGHDVRLREALLEVLQLDVTIDVVHDAEAAGSPSTSPSSSSRSSARPAASSSGQPARSPASAPAPDPAQAPEPEAPAASGPPSRPEGLGARGPAAVPVDEPAEPDEPSEDDPDVDDVDGLALVTRELGARTISEIDHG